MTFRDIIIENKTGYIAPIDVTYEKNYLQKQLIYTIRTGEKSFRRSKKTTIPTLLYVSGVSDVVHRYLSCRCSKPKKLESFNTFVSLIVNKDTLYNNLINIKNGFDKYLQHYRVRVKNVSYIEPNSDQIKIEIAYRSDLIRWGLVDKDLLANYKSSVCMRKGVVKFKTQRILWI